MKSSIRLINLLIDSLLFFVLVVIVATLFKEVISKEYLKILMVVLYYLYYFTFEYFFGQTVGKMFTKTKVVAIDYNSKPRIFNIFIRTLARLIPIDFLSYLFYSNGIHDLVSSTKLIELNK